MNDPDTSIKDMAAELFDENLVKFHLETAMAAACHYEFFDRLLKLNEECGELIAAANRLLRNDRPEATLDAVFEELADVSNVLAQVVAQVSLQGRYESYVNYLRQKLEKTLWIVEGSNGEYD